MVARAPLAPHRDEVDDLTLRRAQRGDHAAFRTLVEHYQRPVWQLIWRMVAPAGRGHRAEDLTQDAFVRVFGALPRFDPAGPARLSTWILTIATRLALNELRAGRAGAAVDDEVIVDAATGPAAPTPGRELQRRELGERLAAAVATLPAGARAVLVLRDLFDLEYAEIARALDLDLGTVKSRLARARAAVRARLAGDGELS